LFTSQSTFFFPATAIFQPPPLHAQHPVVVMKDEIAKNAGTRYTPLCFPNIGLKGFCLPLYDQEQNS
jgi:hypothetical protein